jgi:hypothetical protein
MRGCEGRKIINAPYFLCSNCNHLTNLQELLLATAFIPSFTIGVSANGNEDKDPQANILMQIINFLLLIK